MKRYLLMCLFVSVLTISLSGCNKDDAKERIEVVTISPIPVLNGTIPNSDKLVKCMEVTTEGTSNRYYLALGLIEGFEYIEGYKYKLKILIKKIQNPPMDWYNEEYKLIEVIYKQKIE